MPVVVRWGPERRGRGSSRRTRPPPEDPAARLTEAPVTRCGNPWPSIRSCASRTIGAAVFRNGTSTGPMRRRRDRSARGPVLQEAARPASAPAREAVRLSRSHAAARPGRARRSRPRAGPAPSQCRPRETVRDARGRTLPLSQFLETSTSTSGSHSRVRLRIVRWSPALRSRSSSSSCRFHRPASAAASCHSNPR